MFFHLYSQRPQRLPAQIHSQKRVQYILYVLVYQSLKFRQCWKKKTSLQTLIRLKCSSVMIAADVKHFSFPSYFKPEALPKPGVANLLLGRALKHEQGVYTVYVCVCSERNEGHYSTAAVKTAVESRFTSIL